MIPGHGIVGDPVLGDQAPRGRISEYDRFILQSQRSSVYLCTIEMRRKEAGGLQKAPTHILGDPVLGDQPVGGFELGDLERLFLSSTSWIGRPDDFRRTNVPARPRLSNAANITRTFPFLPGESSLATTTTGYVEIANSDRAFDYLPASMTADGYPVKVWHGPLDGYFADFERRFAARGRSFEGRNDRVRLQLQNDLDPIAFPLASSYYTGNGLLDGDPELAGLAVPTCLGTCKNVSLTRINQANEIWQVAQGPLQGINAVYEGGIELVFGADYADLSELVASAIAPGGYNTCRALGLVKFDGPIPQGTQFIRTADVQGLVVDGKWLSTLSDMIEYVLANRTALESNEVDRASVLGIAPIQAGYFSGTADVTAAQFLNDAVRSIVGFYGFNRDGFYRVKQVLAPAEYEAGTPIRVSGARLVAEHFDTFVRSEQAVFYNRNWTPMSDDQIAGAVDIERRRYLKRSGDSVVVQNGSAAAFHPHTARAGEPIISLAADKDTATQIARRVIKMLGQEMSTYTFECGRAGFKLDGGDPAVFETDRYGANGQVFVIREIQERSDDERLTVKALGTPSRI